MSGERRSWTAKSGTETIRLGCFWPTVETATPLTDLAGVKIYWGTASSNYQWLVDVGMATNHTLTGLQYAVEYFITGTAYNTAGLESDFCPEITKIADIGGVVRL